MWKNIFGSTPVAQQVSYQQQLAQVQAQALQNAQRQFAAQQAAMQNISGFGASSSYQTPLWESPKWMVNGQPMSEDEFLNTVFPEDCEEKTLFILKYIKPRKEEEKK
ncbi:MAG TPA: hypothetical protein VFM18_11775 [Methanosarcina sp.]|nr:hypothetical protein [Methanosarcina sp.]